ncbi:tetratricopeptide repeat protein [Ferruginibacter sp.]|nr:tetratricopeptide repeat protein [Ferruginibacter sp.]
MKKTLPLLAFFAAVFFVSALTTGCNNSEAKLKAYVNEQNSLEIPDLLERNGELATAAEWSKTKEKTAELKAKLAAQPADIKTRLQLATIFITEQRITGEHHFYYPAIEKILNGVLSIDPKNFEATVYKASLRMSQHQFADAKKLAEEAKTINPDNAYVYGILVDANVELGNYEEAVAMSDKMQALKPSLESYSRASYLREIYGDYPGAIEAMKLAVKAGLPGSEPQCWSLNVLGDLYYNTGNWAAAENAYAENLAIRPSYAPSMAGLAKVETKKKNYARALALLDSANAVMPQSSFEEQKADVYAAMGDTKKAMDKYAEVQKLLITDANSGHHSVSLELTKSFIKTNQWDSAKKYATMEYAIRSKNIDVNNELAWIAYNQKDNAKAKEYLKTALSTGSKNPELLVRATAINTK